MTSEPFTSQACGLRTRHDLQHMCISLLEPLTPFFSPGKARVKLGRVATYYDAVADEIEGFTRPLWGLASLLAGGGKYQGTEAYVEGIRHGTDPDHREFWGFPQNRDQRAVEMCPIAYALMVAPETFWDPLTDLEKQNVATWLYSINDKEVLQYPTMAAAC